MLDHRLIEAHNYLGKHEWVELNDERNAIINILTVCKTCGCAGWYHNSTKSMPLNISGLNAQRWLDAMYNYDQ